MVQIPAEQVVEAARALRLAGRWSVAEQLLAAVGGAAPGERAALAVAAADVAVDGDFWRATTTAGPALERAAQELAAWELAAWELDARELAGAAAGAPAARLRCDLELLRLRQDYYAELLGPDGPRFGPGGRDPAVIDELAARARRLRASAPDRSGAGEAAFCAGLVEDNLRGDSAAARPLFAEGVAAGEESGDDLLASESLRHLGYLNHQAGEPELARQQWQRATVLRQRAGCVPLTLAQQLLIAQMAAADGAAAVRPQVEEIRRWAQELGLPVLIAQADALLASGAGAAG
jgi:hypothetical protein